MAWAVMRSVAVGVGVTLALAGGAWAQADPPAASSYQNLTETLLSGNQTVLDQTVVYPTGPANITTAIVTVPPGGQTGWHVHDVPLMAYILEGELSVDYGSRGTRLYVAGDALLEAMNWPHNGTNTGTIPVRIFAVYIGVEAVPNAAMVPGPL